MSRADRTTWLIAAAGLVLVVVLAQLVVTRVSRSFDLAVIDVVRDPSLVEPLGFLRAMSALASTEAVIGVAILIAVVGLATGPWLHGLIGAVVVGLTSVATSLAKAFIARERPDLLEPLVTEAGFSFPSGHAILGTVAWGVMGVLVTRSRLPRLVRLGVIGAVAVLIVLIGVSRVYLGVHFPTDVLAGWTAGVVIVFLYARLTRAVPRAPAVEAVDEDPGAPRSDRPAPG